MNNNNNNNNASISYYNFYAPNATSLAPASFNWPQSKPYDIQNSTEPQSNYRNQYDAAYDTLLARGTKPAHGFNVRHFNSTHRKLKWPFNTTQVYKKTTK